MNRRGFLRGLLAGAALATGLARTKLTLVDDAPQLTYRGVPLFFDGAFCADCTAVYEWHEVGFFVDGESRDPSATVVQLLTEKLERARGDIDLLFNHLEETGL